MEIRRGENNIVGGVSDESNYYSRLTTEKITKEILDKCKGGSPTECQTEIASNGEIPMQGNKSKILKGGLRN